jgi:hypothetical protein
VPRGVDTWKHPCLRRDYPFSLLAIKHYFHRDRQNPARPSARPLATLPARRTILLGLPDARLLMLFEARASRYKLLVNERLRDIVIIIVVVVVAPHCHEAGGQGVLRVLTDGREAFVDFA